MTFGYPSARYLLSRHRTHLSHGNRGGNLGSNLGRSSSQSPLPDEAYISLLDTVPYIFSSPIAVDVLAQHLPTPPVSGHLSDNANQSALTRSNSTRFDMDNNYSLNRIDLAQTQSPSGRPRSAPSSSLLSLFNSESFDALAHRQQLPLSPDVVGTMSREETRTLLADDLEAMMRLGHAVEEARTYREAWVDVPSDAELGDEEEQGQTAPAEAGSSATWSPPFPLSIDPHLRLPRRHGRPQASRGANLVTAAANAEDDDGPTGHNPFLSSNIDALNAYLSHLPPLSPSSGVTDMATHLSTPQNFSNFRRRPLTAQQPNDQLSTSSGHLRTVTGGFSLLPDVPLSPMRPRFHAGNHTAYALPSTGAYTHHVDSPTASSSTDTGMPHPGDMTVMDLVRRDPYGAHLHWEDVQAVARAERERHLIHLDRYGWVERGVSTGVAVGSTEWETKMIR